MFRIKPSKVTDKPKSLVGVKTPKFSKQRAEKLVKMTDNEGQSEAINDLPKSSGTSSSAEGVGDSRVGEEKYVGSRHDQQEPKISNQNPKNESDKKMNPKRE